MTKSETRFSSGLKLSLTIVSLLTVVCTVVAGVIDTRTRVISLEQTVEGVSDRTGETCNKVLKAESDVRVLERDTELLADELKDDRLEQKKQFKEIQESLHKIDKEQAIIGQKIEDLIDKFTGR